MDPRWTNRVARLGLAFTIVLVALWGATIVALSTIVIAQITKADISHVLFDVISAFGTVGLSTGITYELWRSCDAVADDASFVMLGTPNCGKGEPGQVAHVGHAVSGARFRNVQVGVGKW